jgi:hypothetical protein
MVMSEWKIGKDLEVSDRGLIWRYYAETCLEGLRKTTEILIQDSGSTSRHWNPGPPKYEAGILTTRLRHSVRRLL